MENKDKYKVLRFAITKAEIDKLLNDYVKEHHLTLGKKKFLKHVPMWSWKLQVPTSHIRELGESNVENDIYDFSVYFKKFLNNPYLPQQMKQYKSKYELKWKKSRDYCFILYRKECIERGKRGYFKNVGEEYGYGIRICGSDIVYPVACFPDINDGNKQLGSSSYKEYYYSSGSYFYGKSYYYFSDLLSAEPLFNGTEGDLKATLEQLNLSDKSKLPICYARHLESMS